MRQHQLVAHDADDNLSEGIEDETYWRMGPYEAANQAAHINRKYE
jgi:hypothetical protein